MKLRVVVTLKPGVLDPAGRAVQRSLSELGYPSVTDARIGKLIELEIDAAGEDEARAIARDACEKLLANPVIETYELL